MSEPAVRPAVAKERRRRRHSSVSQIGPGTKVGPYVVERRLGAGGFGTVFLARQGDQLHALKFLSLKDHSGWAEREVVVLSRVGQGHVAQLRGFWRWPEAQPRYLVVVMEYVAGRRLDTWVDEENPSARRVLQLLRDLSQGLGAVHAAGVVHRDVKEANVLVREEDGAAVLVDFGVSGCEEAAPVTRGVMPPGTWEYRSPEAWRFAREHGFKRGARYRPRPPDDVYAVGVVLYWLLTDDVPFPVENLGDVDAVLNQEPVAPHERNPRVPRELSELCLRLLVKQPEARPDAAGLEKGVDGLLARQGPEWEEPLCEPHGEPLLPSDGAEDVDEEEKWARGPSKPRRGKRPVLPVAPEPSSMAVPKPLPASDSVPVAPVAVPIPEPAAAPEQPVAFAQPPACQVSSRRRCVTGAAAVGLLLSLGGLSAWFALQGHRAASEPSTQSATAEASAAPILLLGWDGNLPTWESEGKVAPPLKPPEAERAAPLESEGASTAPVATDGKAQQREASVKTEQQKQPKRLGAAKKAALLIICTTPACTGPVAEVRPPPVTAEPCPPGSLQAMEQLGIRIGKRADGEFSWHQGNVRPVPIKEGWTTLRMGEDLGQLEAPYQLSGRILLSEKRAYGHWVQATKDGKTYPVCLESNQPRTDEGEVESTVGVEAVREFE
ncbi:serine/threonine protein kinase [Hyalangium versicolor]|uniref:serine/threonine protein kinase n=1 Tax=Hyalangium versicolor TaxID=2861190 RepID=UPI001CCF9BF0|nr:serine/threonine-protein kinase [Hyalangium versicolor]